MPLTTGCISINILSMALAISTCNMSNSRQRVTRVTYLHFYQLASTSQCYTPISNSQQYQLGYQTTALIAMQAGAAKYRPPCPSKAKGSNEVKGAGRTVAVRKQGALRPYSTSQRLYYQIARKAYPRLLILLQKLLQLRRIVRQYRPLLKQSIKSSHNYYTTIATAPYTNTMHRQARRINLPPAANNLDPNCGALCPPLVESVNMRSSMKREGFILIPYSTPLYFIYIRYYHHSNNGVFGSGP